MTPSVERSTILETLGKLIAEKLFHPWWSVKEVEDKAAAIAEFGAGLDDEPEEQFERRINDWLAEFRLSHMAFFHGSGRAVPPQFAIGAELRPFIDGQGCAWFVQHVAEGGVAHQAGIRFGDAVLALNGRNIAPPDEPRFQLGQTHEILLQPRDESRTRALKLELPRGTAKDRPPMVSSRPLSHEILQAKIGLVRVSAFPGAAGFEFARALDEIIGQFKAAGCDRLIVDLRGNPGGGLGSLRLMSYLVPDRRPAGYSLTRKGRARGLKADKLMRIRHIPRTKPGLWAMAFRFGILHRDRSLSLWTERLGPQRFHGKTVLLVDEFTRSAAEMIAAFASRSKVAAVVGAPTPGQVLGAANFRVGGHYRLRIPVTAWYMPDGELIEGKGVHPDHEIRPSLEDLRAGNDVQLGRSIETVLNL
ncbi:MAG: S41 family peptidase [Terriglobia bacterium]